MNECAEYVRYGASGLKAAQRIRKQAAQHFDDRSANDGANRYDNVRKLWAAHKASEWPHMKLLLHRYRQTQQG